MNTVLVFQQSFSIDECPLIATSNVALWMLAVCMRSEDFCTIHSLLQGKFITLLQTVPVHACIIDMVVLLALDV